MQEASNTLLQLSHPFQSSSHGKGGWVSATLVWGGSSVSTELEMSGDPKEVGAAQEKLQHKGLRPPAEALGNSSRGRPKGMW